MIGELAFWGVLFWLGMMAFRYWSNNVPPRKDWNADSEALQETQRFAAWKNRDVTFQDYEAQAFALDHDPRPAA